MKNVSKQYITESRLKRQQVLNELFIKLCDVIKNDTPDKEKQMLRLAIVAEADAVNLYEMMAHNVEDEDLKQLFLDVAREEKVHIGEFEYVLEILDEEYEEAEEEGAEEAEELGFEDEEED